MTVNVKGRSIQIDDKLAEEYEEIGFGPVNELFVLASVGAIYKKSTDEMLTRLTDSDIQKIAENSITEMLSC